jgi:hypothetical protein
MAGWQYTPSLKETTSSYSFEYAHNLSDAAKTGSVTDAHGWAVLYSAAAQWYFHAPFVLQLRYNYAQTSASIKTNTVLIGLGYQFEHAAAPGPVPPSHYDLSTPRIEMTLMAGKSVQNNFQSPQGAAWGAELRAVHAVHRWDRHVPR